MNKHAYLIMAHNEFYILEKLILLLDDLRNDIYIHIDLKVKNFNFKYYKKLVKRSNIYFVERKNVRWGHMSQIKCEILLLKESIGRNYRYYHLLSGVDLPIKTQDEIHSFFEENDGYEFIHFCSEEKTNNIKDRVLHYNFMRYHRSNKDIRIISNKLNNIIKKIQYKINYERKWDKNIEIYFGSNWFSITNELVKYILENEEWINVSFKYSSCADEVFLQTLVCNSKFKKNLFMNIFNNDYKSCLREIDFKNGNPYIYRINDFNKLINSENLFARKFDSRIDKEIINEIFNYLLRVEYKQT